MSSLGLLESSFEKLSNKPKLDIRSSRGAKIWPIRDAQSCAEMAQNIHVIHVMDVFKGYEILYMEYLGAFNCS